MAETSGTNAPTPKVVAATGGAGLGWALQVITIWATEYFSSIDIPDNVENAVGLIFIVVLGFISGYQAPATKNDGTVVPPPVEDDFFGAPNEGTVEP